MFDNFCNLADYQNWLKHANQWMYALLARMATPAELRAMAPMVRSLAQLTRSDVSLLDRFRLTGDTLKLRNMAVNLKEIAEQLGQPVQVGEVTPDLARPWVELPVPPGIAGELGDGWTFEKFLRDLAGGATDILKAAWFQRNAPWLLLAALAFWAVTKDGRAS